MTAQWAVRAAKDRARSSRENRVPFETLRSKSDKAVILIKLRQRIHYIFSFLWVLRRLENIVCRSRFHLRYLFRLLYIDTYICSLGNIPQAVCVRVAKATYDTPYFLRALHEKSAGKRRFS